MNFDISLSTAVNAIGHHFDPRRYADGAANIQCNAFLAAGGVVLLAKIRLKEPTLVQSNQAEPQAARKSTKRRPEEDGASQLEQVQLGGYTPMP